VATFVTDSILL
jgi:hypothetical protein